MGDYLNKHFVSSFQRVGTFRIDGAAKQGGNVASYFCTPEGRVLHVIAGPVNGDTLLKEARWVVEACKLAQLNELSTFAQVQNHFRLVHVIRLQDEYNTSVNAFNLPPIMPKSASNPLGINAFNGTRVLNNNQAKIHQMLVNYPLPRVSQVYTLVFESLLNERISSNPVVLNK